MTGKLLMIALPAAFIVGWVAAELGSPRADASAIEAEHRLDFSIAAGGLKQALEKYARQAGIRLAFDPAMVAGLTTDGLHGRHSVGEGLDTLLRGSGYVGTLQDGHYVLSPETPAAAARPAPGPASPARARMVGMLAT